MTISQHLFNSLSERSPFSIALQEFPHDKRDHHTHLRLIKDRVVPGATIVTDWWRAYNAIPYHGYSTHLTVNHQQGFVDPATGVHTNTCKGMWFYAKRHVRNGHGRTKTYADAMSSALSEFMWMKRMKLTKSSQFIRGCYNRELPELMNI